MASVTDSPQSSPDSWWSRFEPRDVAPFITLAVLVVFFSFASRGFFSPGTITLVLQRGAVLGIVSVGLTFVLLCGEIDLSVGTMALWTACLCGVLFEQPFAAGKGGDQAIPSAAVVALVTAVPLVVAGLLGFLSGYLTVASRMPSFIITLAMQSIAEGLARYLTASQKFAVPGFLERIGNGGLPISRTLSIPYSAFLAGGIMLVGYLVLAHTRFGRYVYMTGGNREAARLAGVRTSRILIASLALCALTAGMGGLVNAGRLGSVSQDQNVDLLLNAVACVVLGGTSLFGGEGGMGRTLIGVLTFSVLKVGLDQINWINDYMRTFLLGVVLMTALVINGLLALRKQRQ
jgi:ribose transport system permease protein